MVHRKGTISAERAFLADLQPGISNPYATLGQSVSQSFCLLVLLMILDPFMVLTRDLTRWSERLPTRHRLRDVCIQFSFWSSLLWGPRPIVTDYSTDADGTRIPMQCHSKIKIKKQNGANETKKEKKKLSVLFKVSRTTCQVHARSPRCKFSTRKESKSARRAVRAVTVYLIFSARNNLHKQPDSASQHLRLRSMFRFK